MSLQQEDAYAFAQMDMSQAIADFIKAARIVGFDDSSIKTSILDAVLEATDGNIDMREGW